MLLHVCWENPTPAAFWSAVVADFVAQFLQGLLGAQLASTVLNKHRFWNPYNKLRRVCLRLTLHKQLPANLQSCRVGLVVTGGSGVTCITTQILENKHSRTAFVLTVSYLKIDCFFQRSVK